MQLLENAQQSSKDSRPVSVCELSMPHDGSNSRLQRSDPTHDDVRPSPLVIPQVYPSRHSAQNLWPADARSSDRAKLLCATHVPVDITRPPLGQDDIPESWSSPRPAPHPPTLMPTGSLLLQHGDFTFTVDKEIGSGSFGFVWHARDQIRREVAIKVINKRMFLDAFTEDDSNNCRSLRCNSKHWSITKCFYRRL